MRRRLDEEVTRSRTTFTYAEYQEVVQVSAEAAFEYLRTNTSLLPRERLNRHYLLARRYFERYDLKTAQMHIEECMERLELAKRPDHLLRLKGKIDEAVTREIADATRLLDVSATSN